MMSGDRDVLGHLTSEDRTIKHSVAGDVEKTHVSWKLVSLLDDNDIARHQVQSRNTCMRSITNDNAPVCWGLMSVDVSLVVRPWRLLTGRAT